MDDDQVERQNEELQVIQAIYMDDYVDHTLGVNNPAEFTLKLVPLQSTVEKDIHARLDLKVSFTTNYPEDPPVLKFENAKGISDRDLNELKEEINKMALGSIGEVMILQIAQHIQDVLHQHNKPNLSFFDQMVANQMKQEEIHFQKQQKIMQAKVAEDREKDQDVIRQVKEELQKRTEEKRKRQISYSSSPHNSITLLADEDVVIRKDPFVCSRSSKDYQKKLLVFNFKARKEDRKVFCSSCVGHFYEGACTLSVIEECSGAQLALSEWKVKLSSPKKKVHFSASEENLHNDSISKQLQSIEQEFNFVKNKLSIAGTLNYHCLEIDQTTSAISIRLLTDPISGPCLHAYLHKDGMSLLQLQATCKQVVEILLNMHNKSIAHHDLNLYNTFINSNNEIMLGGYAVVRRISDLYVSLGANDQEASFLPFGMNSVIIKRDTKRGKKGDVFYLGLMLLSLYIGSTDLEYPVNVPDDVPDIFRSFLTCCLSADEDKRSTVSQLSKHSFLCSKLANGSSTNLQQHNKLKDNSSSGMEGADKQLFAPLFRDTYFPGKSRLLSEFDTLEWLGKGGFGSVIKVKNKLDGNMYALKRIRLNANNSQLNKRITREVKLLSRLNHENVVRYFNSWIEASDVKLIGESSLNETDSDLAAAVAKKHEKNKRNVSPVKRKDLEELLQPHDVVEEITVAVEEGATELESSWCEMTSDDRNLSRSSSSSSSSSLYNRFPPRSLSSLSKRSYHSESSEGIVFHDDSMLQFGDLLDTDEESDDDQPNDGTTETTATTPSSNTSTVNKTTNSTTTTTTEVSSLDDGPLQYLYIQMEYCEKSTLRIVIDDGIFKEPERVRRYFREIVEGLVHVHSQGFIHRDLKPFNIFLDSKDRIKIGDFGLATSHTSIKETSQPNLSEQASNQSNDRMTGKVGTALYVAPELGSAKSKIKFSQKVDMYSLGIILFEMCYKPLPTGMERVKTLGVLRSENKTLPEDFNDKRYSRERYVIAWLINHSPDDRPLAQELLDSGYVPPKIEDSQMDELLRHTLSQTNSTRYQRLMSTLFSQHVSPVSDQIYDSDYYGKNQENVSSAARILYHVRTIVTKVFVKHGGVFIETPLLTPKSKFFDNLSHVATIMDQSGVQLCLPYDSRLSFARYLSRNNIDNMKRFYFGKLYRDKRIIGSHPASAWECSFDIVTSCFSPLLPITELIYSVCELIKEFPTLVERKFYIRLNHLSILKAVFVQNNFTDEARRKVLDILNYTKNKSQLETELFTCLTELGIQEHLVNRLLPLMTFEGTFSKAKDALQSLRKNKANVSSLVKQGLSEIDKLIKCITSLNVDHAIYVCTSLTSNTCSDTGMVFQFVAENTRKKKHGGVDILALGCCYNQLIESMSRYAECSTVPTAVGVSIAVDKLLVASVEELTQDEAGCTATSRLSIDESVLVGSVTITPNIDMLLQVLCELWSAGIAATLFSYEVNQDYTIEEMQDYCKENSTNYLVVLKESDVGYVRVKCREKDKFTDHKVSRNELCDYLKQKIRLENITPKDTEQPQLVKHNSEQGRVTFLFTYVAPFETNRKRIYEGKFEKKFLHEITKYFGSSEVQVVAAKLEASELKFVAAYLELKGSSDEFDSSVQHVVDVYQKNRQFMKRLCNTIHQVYTESQTVVLLYSITAEMYKVLL